MEPPQNQGPAIETYIKAVEWDVIKDLKLKPSNASDDNLTSKEWKASYTLRTRKDIIIKNADKGSPTVVMSHED